MEPLRFPGAPISRESDAEGEDSDMSLDPMTAEETHNTPVTLANLATAIDTQELNLSNETINLLHLDADVTSEPSAEAMDELFSTDTNDGLGRTIDDLTGRNISLRGHKPVKKHDDFVYK